MKIKKYLLIINLIVKTSTFSLVLDDFGQTDVQEQILGEHNTELPSLCVDPNAKIQRVISGSGIDTTIPNKIIFSEPSKKIIKYFSDDNTFNLFHYKQFALNFSSDTQIPLFKLFVKVDLVDSSNRAITYNTPVQGGKQLIDLVSTFQEEKSFETHEVKSILFNFNQNENDIQFALNSIEVIPEPFSVSILGIGIAKLVKKRKHINIDKIKHTF